MIKRILTLFLAILLISPLFSAQDYICIGDQCFPIPAQSDSAQSNSLQSTSPANERTILGSLNGYMTKERFIREIGTILHSTPQKVTFSASPIEYLKTRGLPLTLLIILLAGIALNLTPCVLPMIPVQIAVLGLSSGTRKQNLLRGLIYGLSMALTYGILGIIAAYTGGFFGALQSNPYFNLTIAIIFIILALALFDKISLSFQSHASRTRHLPLLLTGVMDALLAGSCVAPALLAVLVLSSTLFSQGNRLAILFPFVLGIGMGLPWPFIATGLASLPKPGLWMKRVKWVFGSIVILLAIYFLNLASIGLFPPKEELTLTTVSAADLEPAIDEALKNGKPILLDFSASWCRNCTAMDRLTLQDPAVLKRLEDLTIIRVSAENPSEEATSAALKAYNVIGLPAFRIIAVKSSLQETK